MEAYKLVILVYHVLVFTVYALTLTYDTIFLAETPTKRTYAGRFKFLTFWNELIQTAYFGFAVINSLFGSNLDANQLRQSPEKYSRLQRIKDYLAATIVFPVGLFVVLTFWSVYAFDRELIYPAALDKIVPRWLNHIWHSSVIVFTLIEKIFVYQKYPSTRRGLLTVFGFGLVYVLWMFWIAHFGNIWVYPLFEVFSWPQRISFILGCAIVLSICYFSGELFTRIVWLRSASMKKLE